MVLLTVPATVQGGSPAGSAAKAVTDICSEVQYILNVAAALESRVTTAEDNLKKLTDDQHMLSLATAASWPGPRYAAYAALTALAKGRTIAAATALQTKGQQLRNAANTLRKRAHQLQVLQAINPEPAPAWTVSGAGSASGSGTFGMSTEICTLTAPAKAADNTACAGALANKQDLANAAAEINSEIAIKVTKDLMFGRRGQTLKAEAKGQPATASGTKTNDGLCGTTGTAAASASNGLNAVLSFSTAADTNLEDQDIKRQPNSGDGCGDEPADNKLLTVSKDRLAYTICKARGIKIQSSKQVTKETIASLSKDPQMQRIAAILLAQKAVDKEVDITEANTLAILKQAYGSSEDALEQNFVKPLSEGSTTIKIGDQEATGPISELSKEKNFAHTLAFFTARIHRRHATAENKQQQLPPGVTDVCKGEAEKEKCNNTTGCKYNEKDSKCENDPVKAPPTKTNTNTTGSNSFVINKAPLWLAVLLF
uniref:Variant surface glycoprotein 1125.21 n=1 Tax=Trypanosoma brucei TaxID=5691 RepID=A0A1J0R418_9TRYP|nr:variant surface glycoprotein 1125.21 [Trypanosoma brucei]